MLELSAIGETLCPLLIYEGPNTSRGTSVTRSPFIIRMTVVSAWAPEVADLRWYERRDFEAGRDR
jgi:hypothetical protein